MRSVRTLTVVAVKGFLVMAFMSGQTAANAATQNLIYDCFSNAPVTLTVAPGDDLVFTNNCGNAPGATAVNAALFTSYPTSFSGWPQTFVVSPSLSQGTYVAAFEMFAASHTIYTLQNGAVGGSPSSTQSPPDWMQAYGRAQAESCRAGWSSSWARWPNAGTGGFVCNRTLTWQGAEVSGR